MNNELVLSTLNLSIFWHSITYSSPTEPSIIPTVDIHVVCCYIYMYLHYVVVISQLHVEIYVCISIGGGGHDYIVEVNGRTPSILFSSSQIRPSPHNTPYLSLRQSLETGRR